MRKWVRHVSGQGEKWEIDVDDLKNNYSVFTVKAKSPGNLRPVLPKSEYFICEPPERWVDVTEDTKITKVAMYNSAIKQEEWNGLFHECSNVMWPGNGYRLRKVCACDPMPPVAFVIEKKVSE